MFFHVGALCLSLRNMFLWTKVPAIICHNSEPEDQIRSAEPLVFATTIVNPATNQDPTLLSSESIWCWYVFQVFIFSSWLACDAMSFLQLQQDAERYSVLCYQPVGLEGTCTELMDAHVQVELS